MISQTLKMKMAGLVRKLLSLRATPQQIGAGFSIGVFIGILPTFGLGALIILAIAPVWKFNIPAAILGTLMGNPLFAPVWIALSCLIMGISPSEIKMPQEPFRQILGHYSQIGLKYLLGNVGVSLVVAIVSYFAVVQTIKGYRGRKAAESPVTTNQLNE